MSIVTSQKTRTDEKKIIDSRVAKAIDNLMIKSQGDLAPRLETIVEKKEIDSCGCLTYCYSIKSDANGNLRLEDLADFLDTKLLEYSIPKKLIDEAREHHIATNSPSKIVELDRKAKSLFTHLDKTGEGGELLLYLLIVEILGFPQLMSKMSLKTSSEMHYHGADGIHFDYSSDDSLLSLYWGESKLYQDLRTGLNKCFESIKLFLTDPIGNGSVQSRDLHLVTSNLSANINDPGLEDFLVDFFDKGHVKSNQVVYKGACLVGFDSDIYEHEVGVATAELASGKLDKWIQDVSDKIDLYPEIKQKEIHMFLLPFPSVKGFRELFIKKLN